MVDLLFIEDDEPVDPRTGEGGSRLAIVFNGSPLFTGGAGGAESEIRKGSSRTTGRGDPAPPPLLPSCSSSLNAVALSSPPKQVAANEIDADHSKTRDLGPRCSQHGSLSVKVR